MIQNTKIITPHMTPSSSANVYVSLGETHIRKRTAEFLVATGLGSCVALIVYEPEKKIAGMCHIVLPLPPKELSSDALPGKYAATAVPYLLNEMKANGADINRCIIKIAGGAQMFPPKEITAPIAEDNPMNIGLRNVIATKAALKELGITPAKAHTGGPLGRTVRLEVTSGKTWIQVVGKEEILW